MPHRVSRRDLLLASTCLMFSSPSLVAEQANGRWRRDFDRFVEDGLARVKVPGLGVAMIRKDRTLFAGGYGLADVKNRIPVTADSAFHVASVSKLVTATAMMQLQEVGFYQLDDPIGRYLDFEVVNPKFLDRPITFRHLYTHTSSISDDVEDATSAFQVAGDPTLPLREFLAGYLSPGGRWYDPKKTFTDAAPGEKWQYSNVGIGLLGYLAGRVGTVSLDPLAQQQLFDPLGMHNTSCSLADSCGRWLNGCTTKPHATRPSVSGISLRTIMSALPLITVSVVLLGIIGIAVLTVRCARKSSRRAAFLGWGLQFMGAGVNPVPPPQVQLEEVNCQARIKKDAESGDPKE
jgi:CubicO group peptidase (beta-lactamase class C family)